MDPFFLFVKEDDCTYMTAHLVLSMSFLTFTAIRRRLIPVMEEAGGIYTTTTGQKVSYHVPATQICLTFQIPLPKPLLLIP